MHLQELSNAGATTDGDGKNLAVQLALAKAECTALEIDAEQLNQFMQTDDVLPGPMQRVDKA